MTIRPGALVPLYRCPAEVFRRENGRQPIVQPRQIRVVRALAPGELEALVEVGLGVVVACRQDGAERGKGGLGFPNLVGLPDA
jgi:hypothetical protein